MKFKNSANACIISLGFGIVASVLTAVIVSVLFALLVSALSVPYKTMPLLATVTVALTGIAGGYVTSRVFKKKGLLTGAFLGVILSVILTLVSVLVTEASPSAGGLIKILVIVVAAMTGGVLGVNTKQKR